MNREEQIKDTAEKFYLNNEQNNYEDERLYKAFIRGAKWADDNPHWVSIDDELPPCDETAWEPYLVRTSIRTGSMMKGTMFVAIYTDKGFIILGDRRAENKITHWMRIPKQPQDME